jgi:protease-4
MNDSWKPRPRLAVVVAEGEIAEKSGRNPFMPRGDVTPPGMDHAFKQALADDLVRGIIFRINSPGGEAIAGDRIEHFARSAADKRPMVVSMSNIAASGGYYITTAARKLYANPGTVTGSIGIYGGKVDLSGLYDKIDMGKELYTRGRFAGMLTFMRPFSEEEREKYYSQLEAFYDHFVEIVADNRGLSPDSVDHLSRGRVWTGEQARRNGLVDQLGGLHSALESTAGELGLSDYDVVIFPEERPLIIFPGSSFINTVASIFSGNDDPVEAAASTVIPDDNVALMTRLPFNITIE